MSLFEQTNQNIPNAPPAYKYSRLVFDIETVPQDSLSSLQQEYLDKKFARNSDRGINHGLEEAEHRRKICSLDAYLGKIACISVYFPDGPEEYNYAEQNEANILEGFWKLIDGYNDGIFISYNGRGFDIPFIIRRSIVHKILPTNPNFLNYTKYNPFPPHYDCLLELCGRDMYMSLEQACEMLGIVSPKDGEITNSTVHIAYANGQFDKIAEYCARDLKATYQVFQRIKKYTPINNR